MKFLVSVSALVATASALSIQAGKRDTPIDVTLEVVGNTDIKAVITNTGSTDLKVFKTGSILDSNPVEKTAIFAGSEKIEFDGLRLRVQTVGLPEDAFQVIAAGESVETTFDVAVVHDLSAGGEFDISTSGALSYAELDSTELTGAVTYSSNVVTASVDGTAAAKVRRDFHEHAKRQVVQSDCTGTKLTATKNALTNCRAVAAAASAAAASGSADKMTEYFKSSTSTTRSTVAGVFGKIVTECGSSTSGVSKQYCSDVYGACSSGVLAYTLPSASYMVNCNLYFTGLSALSGTCHAQDQATTTLHETTHLTQIKGTTDQNGCYGYSCVRSLTAAQNLNHADTYALFANAIHVGC
ncbi:hypothetical protein GQ53DRAFT_644593 [Thozetella sp. PMI_491]|nr:hypothetical protein GQ53DRAFT_644593 [Thozetella sp. PMI_491]